MTVTTPFGQFEFNVTSFGLHNASQTFQRLIDKVIRDLEFCEVYLDDVLVVSSSEEEHLRHLNKLLFEEYEIAINVDKFVFVIQTFI